MKDVLISREALKKEFDIIASNSATGNLQTIPIKYIKQIIDKIPIIEERPTGEWIEDSGNIACSHCYTIWLYRKTDFCPNCGAKMKGEEE